MLLAELFDLAMGLIDWLLGRKRDSAEEPVIVESRQDVPKITQPPTQAQEIADMADPNRYKPGKALSRAKVVTAEPKMDAKLAEAMKTANHALQIAQSATQAANQAAQAAEAAKVMGPQPPPAPPSNIRVEGDAIVAGPTANGVEWIFALDDAGLPVVGIGRGENVAWYILDAAE